MPEESRVFQRKGEGYVPQFKVTEEKPVKVEHLGVRKYLHDGARIRKGLARVGVHDGARFRRIVSSGYRRARQERIDPQKVKRLKTLAARALRAGESLIITPSPGPRRRSARTPARIGRKYTCRQCGAKYRRWLKQCGQCGAPFALARQRAGSRRHLE